MVLSRWIFVLDHVLFGSLSFYDFLCAFPSIDLSLAPIMIHGRQQNAFWKVWALEYQQRAYFAEYQCIQYLGQNCDFGSINGLPNFLGRFGFGFRKHVFDTLPREPTKGLLGQNGEHRKKQNYLSNLMVRLVCWFWVFAAVGRARIRFWRVYEGLDVSGRLLSDGRNQSYLRPF